MTEEWKDVVGFEGIYKISSLGNLKSVDRMSSYKGTMNGRRIKGRLLHPRKDKNGYLVTTIGKQDGFRKTVKIHRLVAEAFIPNPENKETVNHINEIKDDNRACNLQWATYAENTNHGTRNERVARKMKGRRHEYMEGRKNYFWGKHFTGSAHPYSKAVNQYSMEGDFIKRYGCIKEAAAAVGVSTAPIIRCCKGTKKQSRGFKWEYA